jgi:deoxyribonuclease (pyrimidine dimer)
MTRINVVPVTELSDKHLSGEFHEISRVFTLARKRGSAHPKAPTHYTLGKGHVLFFYDKLLFISGRYGELACELVRRSQAKGKPSGVDHTRVGLVIATAIKEVPHLFGDYTPTTESMSINRQRILERS